MNPLDRIKSLVLPFKQPPWETISKRYAISWHSWKHPRKSPPERAKTPYLGNTVPQLSNDISHSTQISLLLPGRPPYSPLRGLRLGGRLSGGLPVTPKSCSPVLRGLLPLRGGGPCGLLPASSSRNPGERRRGAASEKRHQVSSPMRGLNGRACPSRDKAMAQAQSLTVARETLAGEPATPHWEPWPTATGRQ